MKTENTIRIDTPPALVWQVTIDVERWPDWNDTMQSVKRLDDGPFGVGSSARIKQRAMKESEWTVTEFVPDERFSWMTSSPGLQMIGSHEVARQEEQTLSRLAVELRGPVGLLLGPFLLLPIRWAIAKENRELKRVCEARATRHGERDRV